MTQTNFDDVQSKRSSSFGDVWSFVELCGAVMRSHDSPRQWTFELVEEYGECEE